MRFGAISVRNLRCLEQLEYTPAPRINLLAGPNGSGKTSVLEALALASTGRSFLTNKWSELIRHGNSALAIRAETYSDSGQHSTIVVKKQRSETWISMDGMPIGTASQLARSAPVLVINSKAPDLLTDNPSNRRALIDRTLFHVEPDYLATWRAYRQVLRQRNELLRTRSRRELSFWNEKFAALATLIDQRRSRLIEIINASLLGSILTGRVGPLEFRYNSGWSSRAPLLLQLEQSWDRDVQMGCTGLGAHRADLTLLADQRPVARHLSRGQAKIVACNLLSALAAYIYEHAANKPVILVDDLAAELDDTLRGHAVDMIGRLGAQTVYTAIRAGDIPEISAAVDHVFHVKRGAGVSTA